MSTSGRRGGISLPWQSGQSGQARPDPVALTTFPMAISRNTAITAAQVNLFMTEILSPPVGRFHGGQRGVGSARRLPSEEHHGDGDEEDHASRNPHDEAAEILIGLRREA